MARSKTIPITTDIEGSYWMCKRDDSPYLYLKGSIKENGKWRVFQKSLKTSERKIANQRAVAFLEGKDFKKTINKEKAKVKTLHQWKDEFLLNYINMHTKKEYDKDLQRFIDFIDKNYPDIDYIHEIEYEHIKKFEAQEKNRVNEKFPDRKISENTLKGELKSVSSWISEARRHKYTKERPFEDFSVGAIKAKKEVFYPEDIKKMLTKHKDSLYSSFAFKAVILLLLQRGLRIEEIINAEREHFKEESRILEIPNPKEKYPKKIHIPRRSCNAIKKISKNNKYLFPNPHKANNEKFYRDKWTKLDRDIRDFCNSLGINGSPHKFRHTFCSYSLKCGANPMDVAIVMGHRRLTTTENYYHIISWDIDDQIKKLFGDWK